MFQSARIKLTIWYLLIIISISMVFSIVIYKALTSEIERFERVQRFRIERRLKENEFIPKDDLWIPQPIMANQELVEETKRRIIFMLIIINGGILFFAGGLGYFLAGKTLKPIKEMVDEQNRFISDASHELRTPLTSLKSAFEVYLREKNPAVGSAKLLIRESIDEVNKMQTLSDELLQLAQYQKPNNNVFKPISLLKVITAAESRIKPLAKKKNIVIKKELINIEIIGDKYSLTDLFVILLDNAIKYSQTGNKVEIKSRKKDGQVEINIRDYGIGISETDLPHIFDRFYRSDRVRLRTATGGYGLGLSIAQKIIMMHKGAIQVSSKIGKGTTFTVFLPIKKQS